MSKFERKAKSQRRVVVTGIGALTPLGLNLSDTWTHLMNGVSGIKKIDSFDPSDLSAQIAGEVKGFDPSLYVNLKDQKKMDRFIHFAIACSEMAINDSGLDVSKESIQNQTGTLIGVGMGGLPMIETQHSLLCERGPSRVSPFFIPAVITNLASGQVSIKYGLKGPNYSVTSACASGAHSIGEAARYIRDGHCLAMLAGGVESVVCSMALAGFSAMKALSTRNSQPELASRPWDKDRDGFVLAEAGALLVLEDYEYASARGAKIYAELSGYGASSDGYHMTTPSPGGEGASRAMKMALEDARLHPSDISYINAHGTSTPAGDEIEVQAIKSVFKDHASQLLVSSTKSMTGHALGAAGAIESAFSVMAASTNMVPPTINLENPSDGCDLDFVVGTGRDHQVNHVLNNSFGFGGTNAVLIFSKI